MTSVHAFLLRLIPPRPTFITDMDDAERAVMGRHVDYWTGLTKEGRALGFGPVAGPDGGYGVGVALAEDGATVESLRDADPVMLSGLGFRYEIEPFLQLVTAERTYP